MVRVLGTSSSKSNGSVIFFPQHSGDPVEMEAERVKVCDGQRKWMTPKKKSPLNQLIKGYMNSETEAAGTDLA